ncbi:MAG: NTP transferase domain-containing protein [Desulfotomaculaceae bacterium]|nr:NTP transferase domain-containing protein [Desulfotomaculaceae bacterium]
MIDAVVLAGSLNNGPLRECSPARYEALIQIGSKVMVEYVVEALLKARQIRRVLVVGPVEELSHILTDARIQLIGTAGDIMENIEAGLNQLTGENRVLLVTSDIPMLTTRSVDNFIELCGDMSSDLYYPIIPRQIVEDHFAFTRRTYVALKDGVYTGGNLFLFNPLVLKKCVQKGQMIIKQRKSPLGLCRLVGLPFLIKYLLHLLTIKDVQKKASEMMGIRGEVIISHCPEVGVDVDKPSDLEIASQYIVTT